MQPLSPTLRPMIWLAIYLLPTFTIREPLIEYDTGWHLRTGRWIHKNRQIPTEDPFTWEAGACGRRNWIAYSWLFGVFLERLNVLSGDTGILLWRTGMAIAITAAIHALVARRQASMMMQALIVAAASVALTSMFLAERPGLFTILFAIATLEGVLRCLDKKPLGECWLLPAIYAVWANIHIQFVHGLFLIGLAGATSLVVRDWAATTRLLLLGCLCAAATLINPYGIRLYEVVLNYGGNREIYALFEELKSLAFRSPADWMVLGIFSAAVFALGRRRDAIFADAVLLAGCAAFSFHARHEVWLVVIVSAAILARWRVPALPEDGPLNWLEKVIVALGVVVAIGAWLMFGNLAEKQKQATLAEFPVKAVDYWLALPERERPATPIFTNIEWGAYVLGRMPDAPLEVDGRIKEWLPSPSVVIDGRAQLHGGPRVKRLHDVIEGLPGWERDPDLLAAGTIIVPKHSPLAELLRKTTGYRLRYEDHNAAVFTR